MVFTGWTCWSEGKTTRNSDKRVVHKRELERQDKRKSVDEEQASANPSQQGMGETPLAPDPDTKIRVTMESSPAPVVSDPNIRNGLR